MLRKRLIGVVTVRQGIAVQSFGYRRYQPLGDPLCLVENLDRWGIDEILLQVIDRSRAESGPDIELLERIGNSGIATPLCYSGGIRSVNDAVKVVESGADRVCIDSLIYQSTDIIKNISIKLGAQAVVVALPLIKSGSHYTTYDYLNKKTVGIENQIRELTDNKYVSEVMLIDVCNEGGIGKFDSSVLDFSHTATVPVILFGGITEPDQVATLLNNSQVSAVAIGNSLNYREHAVQLLKDKVVGSDLRKPEFSEGEGLW